MSKYKLPAVKHALKVSALEACAASQADLLEALKEAQDLAADLAGDRMVSASNLKRFEKLSAAIAKAAGRGVVSKKKPFRGRR